MIPRSVQVLFLTFLAAVPVRAGSADSYHYSRPVPVERAGWLRISLDARAQAQGTAGDDWQIFDPQGGEVASRILRPVTGTLAVRIRQVEKRSTGWLLTIDLGPTPVRHRSIRIDAVRPGTAPGCVLEGSPDLRDWTELVRGDLFRVGDGEGLDQSRLEYPANGNRFLRLHWPESAGFPEIRQVEAEILDDPPGGPTLFPFRIQPLRESAEFREYLMEAPGGGLTPRQIDLGFGGAGPWGLRLFRVEQGRWVPVAEREFSRGERGKTVTLKFGGQPMQSPYLRLVSFPGGGSENRLHTATAAIDPLWLAFRAEEPGNYRLAYGAWEPFPEPPGGSAVGRIGEPLMEVRTGPERFSPSPALSAKLTSPMFPPEEMPSGYTWTVISEDAIPGSWVRLPLPPAVHERTGENPLKWRLFAGDRLLPFLERIRPVPEPLMELRGATAARKEIDHQAVWDLGIDPAASFPNQLEVLTTDAPFQARLSVTIRKDSRPGVESRSLYGSGPRIWTCRESRILPCRLSLDLSVPPEGRTMRILLENPSSGLVPALDLIAWGQIREWIFVQPEGKDVVLRSGFDPDPLPFPLLEDFRHRILAMPWTAARLDLAEGARQEETERRLTGRFLLLVVILAGGVLVVIFLRAILGKAPS